MRRLGKLADAKSSSGVMKVYLGWHFCKQRVMRQVAVEAILCMAVGLGQRY
jgi:hypothetical protein